MAQKRILVTLPPDLYKKIDEEAKNRQWSLSQTMRYAAEQLCTVQSKSREITIEPRFEEPDYFIADVWHGNDTYTYAITEMPGVFEGTLKVKGGEEFTEKIHHDTMEDAIERARQDIRRLIWNELNNRTKK